MQDLITILFLQNRCIRQLSFFLLVFCFVLIRFQNLVVVFADCTDFNNLPDQTL